MKSLRLSLCLTIALLVAGITTATAQVQYHFIGIPFTSWYGTQCPPVCQITGSFTVAQPLPPNMVCDIGGSGCFTPESFSFTDGSTVFTNLNSPTFGFAANTDAGGNITLFSFYMVGPGGGGGLGAYYGGRGQLTQEGVNLDQYQAYVEGEGIPGGCWYLSSARFSRGHCARW
jgi:hypothetical protein